MKRPFMAMCIAGVAGITGALMMPVWAGMILLLVYVCILIFMKRTVSETPYGVWLAVFLLVGFCRVWAGRMMTGQSVESHQVLFGADMLFQGKIQKVSAKENS